MKTASWTSVVHLPQFLVLLLNRTGNSRLWFGPVFHQMIEKCYMLNVLWSLK